MSKKYTKVTSCAPLDVQVKVLELLVESQKKQIAELQEKYNQKCMQKIHIQEMYEEANQMLVDNGLRSSPIRIDHRGA